MTNNQFKFISPDETFTAEMCHYPMVNWNRKTHGSVHLHGHTHGNIDGFNDESMEMRLMWDWMGNLRTIIYCHWRRFINISVAKEMPLDARRLLNIRRCFMRDKDSETKIRPFIQWAGGKCQLLPQLDAALPDMEEIDTYVEPFVGGGAMLFYILANYPGIKNVVINDKNQCLINAYNAVKLYPYDVIDELEFLRQDYNSLSDMEAKKCFYLEMREHFNYCLSAIDGGIDPKLAALFIFINKTCFNALYRVNKKGEFNVPFGKRKTFNFDKEVIIADSEALQNVSINCGDYSSIILDPNTLGGGLMVF